MENATENERERVGFSSVSAKSSPHTREPIGAVHRGQQRLKRASRPCRIAHETGGFLLRAACSARAFHDAMSASSLNITRTPMQPWLTRTLPPFRPFVLGQPCHDLRVLAGPAFELEHPGDVFLFATSDHQQCAPPECAKKVARGPATA